VDLGALFGRFKEVATPFWVDQTEGKNGRWLLAVGLGRYCPPCHRHTYLKTRGLHSFTLELNLSNSRTHS